MPFPKTPRVIYQKNPLQQVICQLRFPSILRIDTEKPVEYQELIRREYPFFQEMMPRIPIELQKVLTHEVVDLLQTRGQISYDFKSEDEKWAVTLSRNFLALTSLEYRQWEHFIQRLETPLKALLEYYEPAFFTRIGLRYQDVIQRSTLGLESADWCELLRPQIAGTLMLCGDEDVRLHVEKTLTEAVIGLEDGQSHVVVKHGLIKKDDETCYLIDSDFFTEKRTEIDHVRDILEYFGERGSRLFRWCITDRLHDAMDPRPL